MSAINFYLLPAPTTIIVRKIRDPLCVVTLACDLLMDSEPTATQQKYLDMIKRAAGRISYQVTSLVTGGIVIN